jgi:hypothetical protein
MLVTYYAVCDANGPVSVKLDGATEAEAVASFGTLDPASAIDGRRVDIEEVLDIDGSDMSEDDFDELLCACGAIICRELCETDPHDMPRWWLWEVVGASPKGKHHEPD